MNCFKKSLFFFFYLSVFSICAFLRKSLCGFCSFSLKCARRLSETQTVPSDPLQEPHPQVESPLLPVEDATIICKSLCLSAFSKWSTVSPKERQKPLPLMEANEDGLGDSLTGIRMFGRRTLVPCQSGTGSGLSRRDAFAVIPASVESADSAARHGPLRGGDYFRQGGSVISVFGCGSLSSFCRVQLSAWQYEKMF